MKKILFFEWEIERISQYQTNKACEFVRLYKLLNTDQGPNARKVRNWCKKAKFCSYYSGLLKWHQESTPSNVVAPTIFDVNLLTLTNEIISFKPLLEWEKLTKRQREIQANKISGKALKLAAEIEADTVPYYPYAWEFIAGNQDPPPDLFIPNETISDLLRKIAAYTMETLPKEEGREKKPGQASPDARAFAKKICRHIWEKYEPTKPIGDKKKNIPASLLVSINRCIISRSSE